MTGFLLAGAALLLRVRTRADGAVRKPIERPAPPVRSNRRQGCSGHCREVWITRKMSMCVLWTLYHRM